MYYAGEESSTFFELASDGITAYDLTEEENSPLYRMEHLKYQQFTGLKDKNGVEIYECDILEWDEAEWGSPFNELVEWSYDQFMMRQSDWAEWCEVVGNKYENPELLEDKQ